MYKLTNSPDCIQRISDGAFIPADPDNRDYREFQQWQEVGNIISPADPVIEEVLLPSVEDQLAALRKAVLTGIKTDLQEIDIAIATNQTEVVSDGSTTVLR